MTEDLGESDIVVINGDSSGACGVGIESTVAKLDVDNHRILILRMGGVTQAKLQETLAAGGEEFAEISVLAGSVAGGKSSTEKVATPSEPGQPLSEVEGQAPGASVVCASCRTCGRRTLDRLVGVQPSILQWQHIL